MLTSLALGFFFTKTLARVTVPPVNTTVGTITFVTGQAGSTLAITGVWQELLSRLARGRFSCALTTTWTSVVFKIYAGAKGCIVKVNNY